METGELQTTVGPLKQITKNSKIDIQEIEGRRSFFFLKRMFDISASAIGITILIPFLIILAIMMKIEDPRGPIFFSQIRVGQNGKQFKMYKIRSMVTNAEELLEDLLDENEVDGAMFKMKEDPRVTKIGKTIRKFSIDELPQLWNVIKGDMSLIGPRPPLEREVAEYTPYDKQRLLIKPGCTGLWQVSGRNSLNFDEMVELDLKYIQNLSLRTDLWILFKTVWVMIKPNSAY